MFLLGTPIRINAKLKNTGTPHNTAKCGARP